jgi:S1-C subfamily serine protease
MQPANKTMSSRFGARLLFGAITIGLWLAPGAWSQRLHGGLGIELESDSDGSGVSVREVFANGPADRGWLRSGDVIERINSRATRNQLEYRRAVAALWIGDTAVVDYRRGKKKRTARLTIDIEPPSGPVMHRQ